MTHREHRHAGVLALCTAALLFTGCSRSNTDPIQVGHIAPESGNGALGHHARWGVSLAVSEVDKSDALIHGRKLIVRHLDNGGKTDVANADAVRMITLNRVVAILADPDDAAVSEIGAAARPYGIPVVSSRNIAEAGTEGPLSLGMSAEYQGRVLGRFVGDGLEPKPQRVLVIFDDTVTRNRELAVAFRQELKETEIVVSSLPYKEAAAFKQAQDEFNKDRPGAVLLVGSTREFLDNLQRGASASGSAQVSWLYGGEVNQVSVISDDAAVAKDMYFATAYTAEAANERGKDFAQRYRSLSSKQDPDVDAVMAYENALWLVEAMRDSTAVAPPQIDEQLRKMTSFDGLTGTINLKDGHAVDRPVFIVQMKGNALKLVKTDRGPKGS